MIPDDILDTENIQVDWNPCYVSYAKAHDKTPDEMIKYDREKWLGGAACGFILWMSERKQEFFKVCPQAFIGNIIGDLNTWRKFLEFTIENPAETWPKEPQILITSSRK